MRMTNVCGNMGAAVNRRKRREGATGHAEPAPCHSDLSVTQWRPLSGGLSGGLSAGQLVQSFRRSPGVPGEETRLHAWPGGARS